MRVWVSVSWRAGGQEEAVQRALAAFAGEDLVDVLAREGGAEGDRVRREARVAALGHGEGGDVEGGQRLRAGPCSDRRSRRPRATISVTALVR